MVCSHSLGGVAPDGVAQSRGDGVGSGSSRRKPSQRSMTPGLTKPVARGGLSGQGRVLLLVKFPSGGFGLKKCAPSELPYAPSPINLHRGGVGRSKKPCIQSLLPPAL